jgi:hypothetical protein
MSLIRIFLTTVNTLATAGEFGLLKDYLTLVGKVLAANEVIIIPGTAMDKEIPHG